MEKDYGWYKPNYEGWGGITGGDGGSAGIGGGSESVEASESTRILINGDGGSIL